jgi:hypothetical protein
MPKFSKIIPVITFAIFLTMWPLTINAQNTVSDNFFSFRFSNNNLVSVLDSIRIKTNYGITYNPNIISPEKVYSGYFENTSIILILDSITSYFDLSYQIIGSTIAIKIPEIKPEAAQKNTNTDIDTTSVIRASGYLMDAKNKELLPYASIFIKNKTLGTISNIDGHFVITLPKNCINDSLSFSYLGYQTTYRKISDLMPEGNIILMKPLTLKINEVTITNYKPEELIRKSIKNIESNYCNQPLYLTAFYRETLQQNSHYVVISEALLKIFKSSYTSQQNDMVNVYKCRKIPMSKTMDTILFKLQGGIYNSLMIDLAKNQTNFMSGENFDYYDYKIADIISIQGHIAYIIEFDQKDGISYPLYKGKIYIDTESFAIMRAEFSLSPKGITYAAETMVRKSPSGIKVRPTEADYLVSYTERNNIWYLSNIREEVTFKIRKRYKLFNMTFRSVVELAVTKIDSLDVKRFRFSESVKSTDIFTEKIIHYDPEFWGKFNYIPPDLSIEEAIAEIREKLEKGEK